MRVKLYHLLLATSITTTLVAQTAPRPWMDQAQTPEARAHELVSRMTLDEKAAQTLNSAPAIPRLGVPEYDYWNEGLHGIARSGYATLFPQAIGMAATWNAPLVEQIGIVVSTEARAKYNEAIRNGNHSIYFGLTVWSPNINIFRDPRWGRGQETYGEDPWLTGTVGLAYVRGLQGPDAMRPRVVATPKHFAVHSGPESSRHRFNVEPSPHDLWDTYLPQFRMAIVEGKADSIMCAYNELNGKPACGSDFLLQQVLRRDWVFNGFVTSDCGAVDDFFEKSAHRYSPDKEHAAATAVLAGTDTNCGETFQALPAAVKAGLLSEADLDRAVERLFTWRFRLGMFDAPSGQPYAQIPFSANRAPAHLALSKQAAEQAMVLLKNDGVLPLQSSRYKTVAVIGPNASSLLALEGNYNAIPHDPLMPVDSLIAALPGVRVLYAQGAPYADGAAVPVDRTMFRPSATSREYGLKAEYFAADPKDPASSFKHAPVITRIDKQIDFDWNAAAPVEGLKQEAYGVRWSGVIVPPRSGDFEFNVDLAHCYPCNDAEHFVIRVDDKVVTTYDAKAQPGRESATPHFHINFADTKSHAMLVEYTHSAPYFGGGLTLQWVPPAGILLPAAMEAAKQADLVIAYVGLSPELEGEEMKVKIKGFDGGDRTDIQLPESQETMLEDVAALGKPMVVVLLNGSALAVEWAQQHANAVLEAWYPGEFGGEAIAETLTGRNNPAGRLPVTFYKSVEDLPAFDDYSMKNRTYRYFEGTPLYRFGYGLSYTHFTYSKLHLAQTAVKAGGSLQAEVEITNDGKADGDEVAELYMMPPASGNGGLSPRLQLAAFERVHLKAGEHRRVNFTLSPRQLSEVDGKGVRSMQAGSYQLSIGGAQPGDGMASSKAQTTTFRIEGNLTLAP